MESVEVTYHCDECLRPSATSKLFLYNNASLCPECLDKEQVNINGAAPSADELKAIVSDMIDKVYAIGLKKHGKHKWYFGETIRHHVDRSIRHASTAMMRRDGNEATEVDGENAIDHMERSVIRGLFALVKLKDNHK